MFVIFHVNPRLQHQIDHSEWFKKGLKKHGIDLIITDKITMPGDIHIISGPWYAKKQWLNHPYVLEIDRCYYRGDPLHVSLGWLRKEGGRFFYKGEGRKAPEIKKTLLGTNSIYLCDFNSQPKIKTDLVRYHPLNYHYVDSLEKTLKRCNKAYGENTTSLVTAALMGLDVVSFQKHHILNYENWLNLIPYVDNSRFEIEAGEPWEYFKAHLK